MEPPKDMERSETHTAGTAPEQASGPVPATAPGKARKKAEAFSNRSAGIGRGIRRGFIDTIIIAAGFSFVVFLHGIWEHMNSPGQHELSSELVLNALIGILGTFVAVLMYVGPFVLIAGANLGYRGYFDKKKKRPPEPSSSAPEPPSSKQER